MHIFSLLMGFLVILLWAVLMFAKPKNLEEINKKRDIKGEPPYTSEEYVNGYKNAKVIGSIILGASLIVFILMFYIMRYS